MLKSDNINLYEFRNSIPKMMKMLFDKEFYFYGVFNNMFKIDDLVMEALEDPNDGYRSSMGAVCHYKSKDDVKTQFHKKPLARVELEAFNGALEDLGLDSYDDNFDGYVLRDLDTNHIWLVFGTDHADDYYPCFKFWYNPDKNQKDYLKLPKDYTPFTEKYPELYLKAREWFDGLRLEFDEY